MSLSSRLHGSVTRAVFVFMAIMFVLHLWMFLRVRREIATGYPDFTIFYTAGRCVLQGQSRKLYDLKMQFDLQRRFASRVRHRANALPFNHPPFEALLFVPLARLPYISAYLAWVAFNLALIFGFWTLVCPHLPKLHYLLRPTPIALLVIFAFYPVAIALLQGQDSILLLFLYSLAFSSLAKRREFRAGLCLGLALFKFQLVLPFVGVLLLRRQGKAIAGFITAGFALLLISAALVGWRGLIAYPRFVLQLNSSAAQAGIYARDMPNLRGLIEGTLGATDASGLALIIIVSVALLALPTLHWHLEPDRRFKLSFSLCLTTTILVSFHLLIHDLCVLLLPILVLAELLVADQIVGASERLMLVSSMASLFLTPLYAVVQFSLHETNLMVFAVGVFAAGITMALTSTHRLGRLGHR